MCGDYPWKITFADLAVHLAEIVEFYMVPFSSRYPFVQPFPQALEMDVLATAHTSAGSQQNVTSACLLLREADPAGSLFDFPLLESSLLPGLPHLALYLEGHIQQLPSNFDGITFLQPH